MTKADRIRKHYEDGFLTVQEIARLVGCGDSYVRVVARQRVLPGGESIHDKRWRKANADKLRVKRRPYMRDYMRAYRRRQTSVLEAAE